MTTTTIDIGKSPVQLSELLTLTQDGTEVIISEGDHALARLIPVTASNRRIGNLNPGSISISKDFDEPLSDAFWTGEE